MAEFSPLRQRMIEDMTTRNLSPATQQSYTQWPNSAATVATHRTGWGWRMCGPTNCISSRSSGRGRTSTRSFVHCVSSTASPWVAAMPTSRSSLRANRSDCQWCSAVTRSHGSWKLFPACTTGSP